MILIARIITIELDDTINCICELDMFYGFMSK